MANYEVVRVKLINNQLSKLKSAVENKTRTTLRINKKNFQDEGLLHQLFLTTRQTTKINAFASNMSTDIKLSKPQVSKIIQSAGSFGSWLGNSGEKAPTNVAILLARDNLPWLVSNTITKFERKISGKGAVRL